MRAASLAAQAQSSPPATATRPDVAAIDRDRILAAVTRYLTQPPTPIISLLCARSPGSPHDYYCEAGLPRWPKASRPRLPAHQLLQVRQPNRAQHPHLRRSSPRIATRSSRSDCESHARRRTSAHRRPSLRGSRRSLAARMVRRSGNPHDAAPGLRPGRARPTRGRTVSKRQLRRHPGDAAAGSSRAGLSFLASALSPSDRLALQGWFASYLRWLTQTEDSGPRLPELARDRKDHHGTSWLLQAAAYAL